MVSTNWKQKTALIIFGILLFFLLLEIGLRLGGVVYMSLQRLGNRKAAISDDKSVVRILTLGESTTAGIVNTWPVQLEEILNNRSESIKFEVYNEGIAGTSTAFILSNLEDNIQKYEPDIVITMMGINDKDIHLIYKENWKNRVSLFIRDLRTYKFFDILVTPIKNKYFEDNYLQPYEYQVLYQGIIKTRDEIENTTTVFQNVYEPWAHPGRYYIESLNISNSLPDDYKNDLIKGVEFYKKGNFEMAESYFLEALQHKKDDTSAYLLLGWLYYDIPGRFEEAENMFNKAIELEPNNYLMYLQLARAYNNYRGKMKQADNTFKKVLQLNPSDFDLLLELGWVYQGQGRLDEAEIFFKEASRIKPESAQPYIGLGWVYNDNPDKKEKSEPALRKAIELNPTNPESYNALGYILFNYHDGRIYDAKELLEKALELDSTNFKTYTELGNLYRTLGMLNESIKMYEKAMKINPKDPFIYLEMARTYNRMGISDDEINKMYKKKGFDVNVDMSRTARNITTYHYQELHKKLQKRDITHIAMQYPLRDVNEIKNMLQEYDDVIFISNEENFREALEKGKYEDYFYDRFAGDFGHATEKGNRMIAENVAAVILNLYNYTI